MLWNRFCRAALAIAACSVIAASACAQDAATDASARLRALRAPASKPFTSEEQRPAKPTALYDKNSDEMQHFREELGKTELSTKAKKRLAEIEARKKEEDAEGRKGAYTFVRPVESFYEDLPCIILPEELVRPVLNGNQVKKSDFPDRLKGIRNGQEIRLRTPEGAFVGIFRLDKGLVRTVKYYYD